MLIYFHTRHIAKLLWYYPANKKLIFRYIALSLQYQYKYTNNSVYHVQ